MKIVGCHVQVDGSTDRAALLMWRLVTRQHIDRIDLTVAEQSKQVPDTMHLVGTITLGIWGETVEVPFDIHINSFWDLSGPCKLDYELEDEFLLDLQELLCE